MMQRKPLEEPSRRPRVLLIAGESPLRSVLSTQLATTKCACVMVSTNIEFAIIEQEIFDAVLIDAANAGVRADEAITRIKEIHPGMVERIVVINSGAIEPQTMELVDRLALRKMSHTGAVDRLQETLQEIFMIARSVEPAVEGMHAAQLVFDSFHSPASVGARSSYASTRQLAFRHQDAMIDLLIEPKEESGLVSVAGQVLNASSNTGRNADLAVLLIAGMKTLARTITNHFGEFSLEFECVEEARLEIRLAEGSWASLPLGKMSWIKKRLSGRQAEE